MLGGSVDKPLRDVWNFFGGFYRRMSFYLVERRFSLCRNVTHRFGLVNRMIRQVPWLLTLLIALPLCTGISFTWAAPISITNAGFEDISGESPLNEFTFGPLNGWDLYDPDTITGGGEGPTYFVGTLTPFEPDPIGNPGVFANFPDGAAEGERVAISFNFEGSGGGGEYGLFQTLADALQANTAYNLQVEIGNIASATAMSGEFFDLDGFPGYRVDLLAGGVVIAQDNNSLSGSIDEGEYGTSTVALATGATHPQLGQSLGIRLVNLNQIDPAFTDSDLEVDFDDVRLDAIQVPDPSGDFNMDGLWNCTDVNALVGAIASMSSVLSFDMNSDGVISIADITDPGDGWLAVGGANNPADTGGHTFLVGDANLDGVVDGQDFLAWNDHKFTNVAAWCSDDFNADGLVDGQDFLLWNENKFTSSDSVSAVPEPGAAMLSFISLVLLGFARVRR